MLVSGQPENLWAPSFMPGGTIHLQIDALSAFFLLPVFGLSILTAIYGGSYMARPGRAAPGRVQLVSPEFADRRHGRGCRRA